MIIVTIEIRSAITHKTKRIGRMLIINDGSGTNNRGNYDVFVAHKSHCSGRDEDTYEKPARKGKVKNFPRASYNVWRLISRALLSAFPEENSNGPGKTKNQRNSTDSEIGQSEG